MAATPRLRVLDIGLARLTEIVHSLGKPKYRAKQLWEACVKQNAKDTAQITSFSAADRQKFAEQFSLRATTIDAESRSSDGTVKWLLNCPHAGKRSSSASSLAIEEGTSTLPTKAGDANGDQPLRMEAVYIPEFATSARSGRGTLCVSSQAGCSLSCSFCHTGTQALSGNASPGDVVEQVLTARERISALNQDKTQPAAKHGPLPALSHIVFMGQGEPLLNWANVKRAIGVITAPSPLGLGMAPRRITISTSGVAPVIPRLATETPGVRLALSLHAPNDELRSRIMGINRNWPLETVLGACRDYIHIRLNTLARARAAAAAAAVDDDVDSDDEDSAPDANRDWLSKKPLALSSSVQGGGPRSSLGGGSSRYNGARRVRITFEYVMLDGVNNSTVHAVQLVDLLRKQLRDGLAAPAVAAGGDTNSRQLIRVAGATLISPTAHAHVNLIPFNPWPGSAYTCSSLAAIDAFQGVLLDAGIQCTVRRARGQDVMGACGQLRSTEDRKRGLKASAM
jgi:adenine C2-methylase RlmN of 23S rRNA A2503 and tRNA A37